MAMAVQNFVLMFGDTCIIVHHLVLVNIYGGESVEFFKKVKHRLIDLDKSQKWLEEEITKKTGLFVDSSYLNKIYNGDRNAPKIRAAICEILEIEE